MATCPICFEDIQEKASPDSCDHIFCLTCLEKWSKLGSFCPVDRKRYRKIINLESDSIIQVKSRKRKKLRTVYDFSAKCEICSDESKPEVLLLCDCCDLAFHIHCLSPPLKEIPAGLWFCPTCTKVEKKLKEKNGITKEVEVDLGNCNLLFQKSRRHGQRTKEKFMEVPRTLPSCSGVSDESIKAAMSFERRLPLLRSDFSVIDREFSSIREKFDQEMRLMEEEMNRFRSQLLDREAPRSITQQSHTAATGSDGQTTHRSEVKTWLDGLSSPLIQDSDDGKKLRLRFDVSQYQPEEIVVKTVDNKLQVQAKHEEKSDTKSVYREYNREFLLPKGTNPEMIKSSLSTDGVLTVEAPLPQAALESGITMIPIENK